MSERYTEATKHTYDPGSCPNCGSRNVRVNWVDVSSFTDNEKFFIPGTRECLDCRGR